VLYHGRASFYRFSMPSERQHRLDIVQYGRMLHENGFVAATDGNLSVRLDHERICW
jgi:ribulose-5-phosphate 4-epimerase/fuculose-1-phosphate aldolase